MERTLTIKVIFDSTQANQGIDKTNQKLDYQAGSLKALQIEMKKAEAEVHKLTIGSRAHADAVNKLSIAEKAYVEGSRKVFGSMAQGTRNTANMTMALQAMNYTVRDSPYFFRDFSLGILAIGNNLNPLIDSLIAVNKEAKATGSTFRKELLSALKGSGGVIFAFSVLVSVLQAVVFAMAKSKDKTKEVTEELKTLDKQLNDMSRRQQIAIRISNQVEIDSLEAEAEKERQKWLQQNPKIDKDHDVFKALDAKGAESWLTAEKFKQLEALKEQNKYINYLLEQGESLRKIEAEITDLLEEQKDASAERGMEISKRLKELEEEKKKFGVGIKEEKEAKAKSYFMTNQQIIAEIKRLTILKSQTQVYREQALYMQEIRSLQDELNQFDFERTFGGKYLREHSLKDLDAIKGKLRDVQKEGIEFARTVYNKDDGSFSLSMGKRPNYYKPTGKAKDVKKPKPDLDVSDELEDVDKMATLVGKSLFDAFTHGKLAVDEFLLSLLAVGAQLVIIEGLKYVLSGGVAGIFGLAGFSQGGYVRASQGYTTQGYGTHDYQPALLRAGEMVLNPSQQAELFNIAKGISPRSNGGGSQNVNVSGSIRKSGRDFVFEFENAKSETKRSVGVLSGSKN